MQVFDLIQIKKKSGEFISAIKASVYAEHIIILDHHNPGKTIPLEKGDHITRMTPHGLVDEFEVLLPNYLSVLEREGSSGYRARVRYIKATRAQSQQGRHARHDDMGIYQSQNRTSIEVHGHHAQVRVLSHDYLWGTGDRDGSAQSSWHMASSYRIEEDARELQGMLDRMSAYSGETFYALKQLGEHVIDLNSKGYSPEEISQQLVQSPSQSTHDARQGVSSILREQGSAMLNNLGSNAVFAMLMYVLGFSS